MTRPLRRLLFASVHAYVDPSSGAACTTRDALELLAARGVACRAATAGVLSRERETPVGPILGSLGVAPEVETSSGDEVVRFELGGVDVRLLPTRSSRIEASPDGAEAAALLRLVERELDAFRPQAMLTYGGHPANLTLMAAARRRGVPVAFHLHNLAYDDRSTFADAAAVIVPSEYGRRWYADRLGLCSVAIPPTVVTEKILATDRAPKYLTFVNPQPAKGAALFARIAAELDARRPDVPLLVVEGRATADVLAGLPGGSGLRNLRVMPVAADPRAIYREARAVIVPSRVRETFGRAAAEAMANGIPVLASDRGALPETLGDAGFLFSPPPDDLRPPTTRDAAPWVAAIERLWDDPTLEAWHRDLAVEAARRWTPDVVADRCLACFESIARPA